MRCVLAPKFFWSFAQRDLKPHFSAVSPAREAVKSNDPYTMVSLLAVILHPGLPRLHNPGMTEGEGKGRCRALRRMPQPEFFHPESAGTHPQDVESRLPGKTPYPVRDSFCSPSNGRAKTPNP